MPSAPATDDKPILLDTSPLARALTRRFDRVTRARSRRGMPAPTVLVASEAGSYAYGDRATPFHAASIGKIATSAIAMQLVDEGALTLDTTVQSVLGPQLGILLGDATVLHLLTHTSGAADYYDGRVERGPRFQTLVTREPDRDWTPTDLLEFSRTHQRPVARPGERFLYSDTGFVLAGLMLERAGGAPLHELLRTRIFEPLGMRDSWLMRSTPGEHPAIAPFWIGRVETSTFASVSAGWAGGGIAATADDLLRLIRGLRTGLVSERALAEMSRIRHRVRPGLHYGAGLMEVRFEGFSPLLRGMPRLLGHSGSLGTHLYHDPVHNADIVLGFHGSRTMVASVQSLIAVVRALDRWRA
jgi:D-alanyl-D-alanine carboxypeptidase